jgi:hypothetical protein
MGHFEGLILSLNKFLAKKKKQDWKWMGLPRFLKRHFASANPIPRFPKSYLSDCLQAIKNRDWLVVTKPRKTKGAVKS